MIKNKIQISRNKGFTLLELLVVIGIIALILGIAMTSYSEAQKRSRDSRRRSDLKAMQDALEQYYGANSYKYPAANCSDASTYMKSAWPVDPVNNATYFYNYTTCSTTVYCICAQMEASNTSGNSAAGCVFATSGPFYCVGNLQ
jgi:prepilin-type N-terminal cleavage/methylation domain-containing protein